MDTVKYDDARLNDLVLLPFTDPSLRTKPEEFDFINPQINATDLVSALTEAMLRLGGVGLSANQVGLPYRVFVYGVNGSYTPVFNPKIIGASKETTIFKEGCLSAPGVWLMLKRPTAVVVSYCDVTGAPVDVELSGISSRVFQHEYDHMEGRNFTQLASALKLQRALATLKKKVHHAEKLRAADAIA